MKLLPEIFYNILPNNVRAQKQKESLLISVFKFHFRSTTMTRSFSSSVGSNDSRRMLESQIINQQIAMTSQTQTETERESMASQTDSKTLHKASMTSTITIEDDDDECVIIEGATAFPSTPAMAPPLPPPRTKPVVLAPPRFQVPSGPSSPPNSTTGMEG